MTIAPAELTTSTDTMPVVILRNEKPLKLGIRV
jgi:hypothetical protein